MDRRPIVVISFCRPHYLRQVLDSLSAQTALNDRPIFLFQDNAVSPHSGKRFAPDEAIQECVNVFRDRFPHGTVFLAEHNLGSARNYLRAEEYVFRELGCDVAYFFEDDMVLSPHYLTMLDSIYDGTAGAGRVGYFAAYGNHRLPLSEQREKANQLQHLALHWAYGITRAAWLPLREWLEPYYRICENSDYGDRPTMAIVRHYRKRGFPVDFTTQDHMKKVGSHCLGRININTQACFGRYIGERGLNMTPEKFAARGFAGAELYPEPVDLEFPDDADVARFRAEESALHERRVRDNEARVAARHATKPAKKPSGQSPQ